jgi:hypothetical protein
MTHIKPIIKRMRRKLEIMRQDSKARQDAVHHDVSELLALIDMLERELLVAKPFTTEDIEDIFNEKDVGI